MVQFLDREKNEVVDDRVIVVHETGTLVTILDKRYFTRTTIDASDHILNLSTENYRLQEEVKYLKEENANLRKILEGTLPAKWQKVLFIVDKALGLELYDWQRRYIAGVGTCIPCGRGDGKTLAYILKLILNPGKTIHLYSGTSDYRDLPDGDHGYGYREWFRHTVQHVYNSLVDCGDLDLRTIYFTKEEAKQHDYAPILD